MATLYLGYPSAPEQRQENGYNAVLVDAVDVAAAKLAAIAGKPNGSTDDSKLNAWTYAEVAGTAGTLPNGASVLWLDGVRHGGGARAI